MDEMRVKRENERKEMSLVKLGVPWEKQFCIAEND